MCCINKNIEFQTFLIILYWTWDTNGNYEVIWCENTSLNITCEHDTKIQIQDVKFGPVPADNSDIEELGSDSKGPSLNGTTFRALCNNRTYCFLNDSDEFEKYPYIPRLVNITYKCDFEYVGCYTDNIYRLFTGGSIEVPGNMSALICRKFCSTNADNLPHFGTENGFECYCGFDNEIENLNRTNPTRTYKLEEPISCSYDCQGHTYEKCGYHALITVYTTTTEERDKILHVEEVQMAKCRYNSSITNIDIFSHQKAKQCEHAEIENSIGYDCDANSCWVKRVLPFVPGYIDNNFPKYIKINYTCIAQQKNENGIFVSVYTTQKSSLVGIVTGVVIGLLLICGCLIGLLYIKRGCHCNLHQHTDPNTTSNTQHYDDIGSPSYVLKYDDLTFSTQYEDLSIENQYHNMESANENHSYAAL